MKRKYWIGAATGALAIGLMAGSSQAAPPSTGGNDARAAAGDVSGAQAVHWDRRKYRSYHYYPRRHHRHGYRDYRPYRYDRGYGPGFGFYAGPRYYHRGWW